MMAQSRSEILSLLQRHGVAPNRKLGQNFLVDGNITRRIVNEAGVVPGDRIIEVGAGTGTLTRALAAAGGHVTAFEVDPRLRPMLEEVTSGLDVDLVMADASKIDFAQSFPDGPWLLVANLPYNVGTSLVMDILRHAPAVVRLVVMMQREVAERLVALPGTENYGIPSVVTGLHARARLAFRVPPQVFYPVPRVESAVVIMDRTESPRDAEPALEIARTAFSKRRKMLRGSLRGLIEDPESILIAAGIDPTSRAEDLSPADFVRLAEANR